MHLLSTVLFLSIAVDAKAVLSFAERIPDLSLHSQLEKYSNGNQSWTIPMNDPNPSARASAITAKQAGYLYMPSGASLLGNASYYPGGSMGNVTTASDFQNFLADAAPQANASDSDLAIATATIEKNGGLHNLADYNLLYNGQWTQSIPEGENSGSLTNYTQDLYFSMARLSISPFFVRRLNPTVDHIPFTVDEATVMNLTGSSLASLLADGNLFYVDHSDQANYSHTTLYMAYCEAYFYVHPLSNQFLPLAIKTNAGADLVYTPLDPLNDWLLAKIMFEVNDIFSAAALHLVSTHDLAEIVHLAAIRTLSDSHPIMNVLYRIMTQAYGIRPAGAATLSNPGGVFDSYFGIGGAGLLEYIHDRYWNSNDANFQSSYFETDLTNRGLINCSYGPRLQHFPYFEDASVIEDELRKFMLAFVNSYYPEERTLDNDQEVHSWVPEATNKALVHDFPANQTLDKRALVDVLTHMAFIVSVKHQTLNGADPSQFAATLPFHPAALYAPLPTAKGIPSIMEFLPNATQSLGQIYVFARFNRPLDVTQGRTLINAFSDPTFLAGFNNETAAAAATLKGAMQTISARIQSRTFGHDGLSQGMPVVWKGLDPGQTPYFPFV